MRPSDKAWCALGIGVGVWDTVCPDGEMLSQASARYAQNHPVAAYLVVVSVALHLIDRLPTRVDPVHWLGSGLRKLRCTL